MSEVCQESVSVINKGHQTRTSMHKLELKRKWSMLRQGAHIASASYEEATDATTTKCICA